MRGGGGESVSWGRSSPQKFAPPKPLVRVEETTGKEGHESIEVEFQNSLEKTCVDSRRALRGEIRIKKRDGAKRETKTSTKEKGQVRRLPTGG